MSIGLFYDFQECPKLKSAFLEGRINHVVANARWFCKVEALGSNPGGNYDFFVFFVPVLDLI